VCCFAQTARNSHGTMLMLIPLMLIPGFGNAFILNMHRLGIEHISTQGTRVAATRPGVAIDKCRQVAGMFT
jgi:hypothetical protein